MMVMLVASMIRISAGCISGKLIERVQQLDNACCGQSNDAVTVPWCIIPVGMTHQDAIWCCSCVPKLGQKEYQSMKNTLFYGFLLSGLLVACGDQAVMDPEPGEPPALADFSALDEGWNRIEPGGETVCSDGSPYHFHVRPGDPEKLLFYLEGGGACWMGLNCDPGLQPSYQVNLGNTDPARAHGIFAFDEPRNPFADYTVVMAPYCSGDVHLGDAEQTYEVPEVDERPAGEVHIRHRGWANANTAMQWAFDHVYAPRELFVTGSSAGSIPSPFYAVKMAEQYADANVIQLGDASGGYRGFANFNPYDVWETDRVVAELSYINDIPGDQFSFQHLYIAAAQANPDITLASFDTIEDEVQLQFLALGGMPARSLRPLLEANLEEISGWVPDFRYYVSGGDYHTILLRPELYRNASNGVPLIEWLEQLAAGEPVPNVMCEDCAVVEQH